MASAEWKYMDSLRPPTYVCLRRRCASDGSLPPMTINGRVDKQEWAHVPWSEPFVDIEGPQRRPKEFPLTRVKMMYDDERFYVAAELQESQIWGTITEKNSTMYHENDFEVFLNPDGSRHNYYELELNCLNTIWELLLRKPYKDGHSIVNPYNLDSLRTAVFIDGVTNSPETQSNKWTVELSLDLEELVQFDRRRGRPTGPGDVWRVNFSRVQYQLEAVLNSDTQQLQFAKVPETKEDNIVWAPTGVIDIHRPEKWGFVFFSSQDELSLGQHELKTAGEAFLDEQIAIERVLDAIYYDQRVFHETHDAFAGNMRLLYPSAALIPHPELFKQFGLSPPTILCESEATGSSSRSKPLGRRRSYMAQLDTDDDDEGTTPEERFLSPRSRQIQQREAQGLFENYVVTLKGATQEWNIAHDGRLWLTPSPVNERVDDVEVRDL